MNKRILSTLMAGAAALAIAGAASAADQPQGTQRDAAKEKDAYFAALSQCDALKSVAEKQQCVDTVRKQYGQM